MWFPICLKRWWRQSSILRLYFPNTSISNIFNILQNGSGVLLLLENDIKHKYLERYLLSIKFYLRKSGYFLLRPSCITDIVRLRYCTFISRWNPEMARYTETFNICFRSSETKNIILKVGISLGNTTLGVMSFFLILLLSRVIAVNCAYKWECIIHFMLVIAKQKDMDHIFDCLYL